MKTYLGCPHFCECGHTMQTVLRVWVTPGTDVIEKDDIDWESYGGDWTANECDCVVPSWRVILIENVYHLQHHAWTGNSSEWVTESKHALFDGGESHLRELLEQQMQYRCDNCQKGFRNETEFKPLEQVHKLWERLDPGSIVPHGECPECGAFVYPAERLMESQKC